MRDLTEVARELAEAAKSVQAIWGRASLHPKPGDLMKMFNAAFLPILTKHFAPQPVAMETVVERIANRVCLSEAVPDDHADYMLTILRRILAAELAPVETLLREWQKHLRRENNLSPSKHTEELISQIDTILGGQHGTCE